MRNMRRRRRTRGPEISMLNLIDIIFTMLIFFMVATTFNVYSNLGINVPDSEMKKTETKEQKVEILLNKNKNDSTLLTACCHFCNISKLLKNFIKRMAGSDAVLLRREQICSESHSIVENL